jgi:adhesin transport system outer membrane protein
MKSHTPTCLSRHSRARGNTVKLQTLTLLLAFGASGAAQAGSNATASSVDSRPALGTTPASSQLNLSLASAGKTVSGATTKELLERFQAQRSGQDAPWNRQTLSEAGVRSSLAKLVEVAASRSPKVQQARAQYEARLSDVKATKGQRLPQVEIGSSALSIPVGGSGYERDLKPGLEASITTPIYDFGRIKHTVAGQQQLANAEYETYRAELQNSASQVSVAALELAKNQILSQISSRYVDRLQTLVQMLTDIVAVDTGRGSELTQAKARLLQAKTGHHAIEARIRDQELALRKLVGDAPLPVLDSEKWDLHFGNMNDLLAMLDQHPLMLRARAETASAESNAEAIRASALPQVNWVVSKTTAEDGYGRSQPWETRLSLNWSAFRGGSQRAQRQGALARAEASRQQGEQQRLDLEYQIRTAEQNASTSFERADDLRDLMVETDQVRHAFFEQWHHLGRRTLLDVLSAENDHYNNESGEVASRFDGYRAVFDGYLSAGDLVGWLMDGTAPQPSASAAAP